MGIVKESCTCAGTVLFLCWHHTMFHTLDGKHKLNVTIYRINEYVPAIASQFWLLGIQVRTPDPMGASRKKR